MRSPFPGMDPFIEASNRWEDFHGKLIGEIERFLAQTVPDRYFVLVGERSYVVIAPGDNQKSAYLLQSDVAITSADGEEVTRHAGAPALAVASQPETSPVTMRALVETEFRETFVEIRDLDQAQRLVTCIEILSPSNKRKGTKGWRQYVRKRQALLEGEANLVEIDLLRSGRRMPMADDWPTSPYYLLVSRKAEAPHCTVWPAYFSQPLPTIPVPLEPPDQDIPLAIQPLVDAVFARSRYDRLLNYQRPLRPALSTAESSWMEERLREWQSAK